MDSEVGSQRLSSDDPSQSKCGTIIADHEDPEDLKGDGHEELLRHARSFPPHVLEAFVIPDRVATHGVMDYWCDGRGRYFVVRFFTLAGSQIILEVACSRDNPVICCI